TAGFRFAEKARIGKDDSTRQIGAECARRQPTRPVGGEPGKLEGLPQDICCGELAKKARQLELTCRQGRRALKPHDPRVGTITVLAGKIGTVRWPANDGADTKSTFKR